MNDARLIERLSGTNAHRADAPLPAEVWASDSALQELERRMHMQTQERPTPTTAPKPPTRRKLVLAVAAIVVFVAAFIAAVIFLAEGGDEPDVIEPAPTTVVTTTETTAPQTSTTTVVAETHVVNMDLAPEFVREIRESWDRTAGSFGGTPPEATDEEIIAIGVDVCQHITANPLPTVTARTAQMEAFAAVAAIVADAVGYSYDPQLLDAGFASVAEASYVFAFSDIANDARTRGAAPLCPAPAGTVVCTVYECRLFIAPWNLRASAQN